MNPSPEMLVQWREEYADIMANGTSRAVSVSDLELDDIGEFVGFLAEAIFTGVFVPARLSAVLDESAQIDTEVFRKGVKWTTVIERAKREFTYRLKAPAVKPFAYVDDEGRLVKISGQTYFDGGFIDANKVPASWRPLTLG